MASQWIKAETARRIVADGGNLSDAERLICERAHAGMLTGRATLFYSGDEQKRDCIIPAEFWWARGELALEQDWKAGDFSTWLDQKIELRAFGAEFELDGVLTLLPIERRPIVARSLSVESNPDWLATRAALELIVELEQAYAPAAMRRLLELCSLGFVAARAVQMTRRRERHGASPNVEREWDVPRWFWQEIASSSNARIDWALGSFGGTGYVDRQHIRVDLIGVHFFRAALEAGGAAPDQSSDANQLPTKPRLPDANLNEWWDKKAAVRDGLAIDELLAIARTKFPNNHVSRDRIRDLARGRKRGPKPIGDKSAAE